MYLLRIVKCCIFAYLHIFTHTTEHQPQQYSITVFVAAWHAPCGDIVYCFCGLSVTHSTKFGSSYFADRLSQRTKFGKLIQKALLYINISEL